MKRQFRITGLRPAYGKEINEFIKGFDLGVLGSFVEFDEIATVTLGDNVTEAQLNELPEAIIWAYTKEGHSNVTVIEC